MKIPSSKSNQNGVRESGAGFTLVELVIVIAIFSVLIFVTTQIVQDVLVGSNQQFLALNNIDNARLVTSQFVNEMRNAQIGVDGSYQLNTALSNQIIFYSKAANFGSTVNRINYYLSGTNLWKGVTVPSGSPQSYNIANEVKRIVQTNVVNLSPVFAYYDGNYNGSTNPFTQPINVNTVKFVQMNLTVLNQVKAGSQTSFSISAGATIRNLKNNLGD